MRVNAVMIGLVKSGQHERSWQRQGSQGTESYYENMARSGASPGAGGPGRGGGDPIAFLLPPRALHHRHRHQLRRGPLGRRLAPTAPERAHRRRGTQPRSHAATQRTQPRSARRRQGRWEPRSRLQELGITLPAPLAPVANYIGCVRVGNLLFLSGHGPLRPEWVPSATGKVGRDLDVERAYAVAREVGLNPLATTRAELGSLDRVRRVVKVLGMVHSAPGSGQQPQVINGFSDLMIDVFGEAIGKHARSAVGMAELPMGIPVEIEMILEVE